MEYINIINDCEKIDSNKSKHDNMVDLSHEEKSMETSYMFKGNDSKLKPPLLDYGIESGNNLNMNPTPKLMD